MRKWEYCELRYTKNKGKGWRITRSNGEQQFISEKQSSFIGLLGLMGEKCWELIHYDYVLEFGPTVFFKRPIEG
jgi:predicted small integral membrane protein